MSEDQTSTQSPATLWHAPTIQGRLPDDRELGPAARFSNASVLGALSCARTGEIYDLDMGRWPGMPVPTPDPEFQVLTHRSPQGQRVQGDAEHFRGPNGLVGWIGDVVIAPTHAGTHIDALAHITAGEDQHWYGDHASADWLGDFGPLRADSAAIPPIVTRGVFVDVAGHKQVEALPPGYSITAEDLEGALAAHGVEVRIGDSVMVRTGYLPWALAAGTLAGERAGIGVEACRWLVERGVVLIGADNPGVEPTPWAPDGDGDSLPVHRYLLVESGVHMLEMMYLDALAADGVHEFCFLCSAPKIAGTTGSFVRPLAIC